MQRFAVLSAHILARTLERKAEVTLRTMQQIDDALHGRPLSTFNGEIPAGVHAAY